MAPMSIWSSSGSSGLTKRPETVCRYGPGAGGPGVMVRQSYDRLTLTDSHRPGVTSFVHIGLVVEDLDETVRFLALLGFDCSKPGVFSGGWDDRVNGLENVTGGTVMARAPHGRDKFRGGGFHSPCAAAQKPAPAPDLP